MEDILASIRRILNEEETTSETEAAPAGDDVDDVLVLDQSMLVPSAEPEAGEAEPVEPAPDVAEPVASVPVVEPAVPPMEAPTSSAQADSAESAAISSDLVAPEAAAAAASSVGSLVRTLAAGRATQVYAGGPTLEDMVRAELRPLLKEWLDVNLPPVVERLVRTEIERVVGRAVP
jgi:cell pole-organizing protein PopZ